MSQRAGTQAGARALRNIGSAILRVAPWLMKALSIAGTAAMFLVGGGILVHGIPALHHAIAAVGQGAGSIVGALWPLLADALVGVAAGAVALAVVSVGQRLWRRPTAVPSD
jgi:hypothetical protein